MEREFYRKCCSHTYAYRDACSHAYTYADCDAYPYPDGYPCTRRVRWH